MQQEGGEAAEAAEPYVVPIITKQGTLEDKKHVRAQESPDKPAAPEPDVHDQRPSVAEYSALHVLPAAQHDELQGHTLNAAEQPAGPSAAINKFSHLSPVLLEMKQQIEQFTESRLQRLSHLDQVRDLGHSLK
jgi:hypothetical protein